MLLALAAASAWGQAGASVPVIIDGRISAGEYTFTKTDNGITVAARLSADAKTLFIAVSAATPGWVAIGVGSNKMSGAFMVLGFVNGGKQTISTEMGKGHSHSLVAATDVVSVVTEISGVTTLELSMPASQAVKAGAVAAIAAFGMQDNAKSIHSKRMPLDIQL
jgi:hypothetical protein